MYIKILLFTSSTPMRSEVNYRGKNNKRSNVKSRQLKEHSLSDKNLDSSTLHSVLSLENNDFFKGIRSARRGVLSKSSILMLDLV